MNRTLLAILVVAATGPRALAGQGGRDAIPQPERRVAGSPPKVQVLVKKGADGEIKYYGHVKEGDPKTFVTCYGAELTVAPGIVDNVTVKCTGAAVTPLEAAVKLFDVRNHILTLTDQHGNDLRVFTSEQEEQLLGGVRPRMRVTLEARADGRVLLLDQRLRGGH